MKCENYIFGKKFVVTPTSRLHFLDTLFWVVLKVFKLLLQINTQIAINTTK
jgi:hypothetical protein